MEKRICEIYLTDGELNALLVGMAIRVNALTLLIENEAYDPVDKAHWLEKLSLATSAAQALWQVK